MAEALRARIWLTAMVLTVFWHMLLFVMPWSKFFPHTTQAPPPIKINQVDPAKLAQLKRQWAKKSLLLKQNLKAQKEKPKNARYLSDKNASVEKEQRARNTRVTPKQGGGQANPQGAQQDFPQLSNLGVPMKLQGSKSPQRQGPGQGESADQALTDKTLPLGGENLLNSEQSVFYSYYARLYEEVGPPWESRIRTITQRRNLPPGQYVAQVDVVFDGKGNLLEVRFLKSSMVPELDDAIVSTWKRIRRFPNPPRELLDEQGEVHTGWSFTVNITDDYRLRYSAPRRTY